MMDEAGLQQIIWPEIIQCVVSVSFLLVLASPNPHSLIDPSW